MEFIVVVALLGLIPGMVASRKGRSFGIWWLYGAALFIVALPHALLIDARGSTPQILQEVLAQVEQSPGQVQEALATRSGLQMPQLIDALVELKRRDMIRFKLTGQDIIVGKDSVPEVRVYPTGETGVA